MPKDATNPYDLNPEGLEKMKIHLEKIDQIQIRLDDAHRNQDYFRMKLRYLAPAVNAALSNVYDNMARSHAFDMLYLDIIGTEVIEPLKATIETNRTYLEEANNHWAIVNGEMMVANKQKAEIIVKYPKKAKPN